MTASLLDRASTMQSPAFTQTVVSAMRELYPEQLADRKWDNVGLLQDNIDPSHPLSPITNSAVPHTVLLTNDLTLRVAEEAISKRASVIVSYHPFIFRGLKSITLNDPQQRITLLLAQHNIAVYSPHTAVDAVPGGLNDWLAEMTVSAAAAQNTQTTTTVVQPISGPTPAGFENSGYGRLVMLSKPIQLRDVVNAYRKGLGMSNAMIARPKPVLRPEGVAHAEVRTVAVCAGSGGDVIGESGAELLVTGEMSHHHALKAVMRGQTVLTFFHSNSERAFLRARMQPALEKALREQVADAKVLVSEEDEDPFEVLDIQGIH